jgi:hypothetical protein
MLSVIQELSTMADAVTPQQMRRVERQLIPLEEDDTVLGVIHNEEARRWIVVHTLLRAQADKEAHHGAFESDTLEQQQVFELAANRAILYSRVAANLFWLQAREDFGGSAWSLKDVTVGIRTGWTLVTSPTPSPSNMLRGLLQSLRGEQNEEEED